MIYARYSTDEQDDSSITDQVAVCRRHLQEMGLADSEVSVLSDVAMSGELRHRPDVDRLWSGVAAQEWDLVICEDSSRLYRNLSACLEFVETASDKGVRIIFINDKIDTAVDGWEERLSLTASDHARANHYLRRRLFRKALGLWESGAAMTMVRPGYQRQSSVPATLGHRAKGPHFDTVDPQWAPTIRETFERIADGESAWQVASWLTQTGLPKYCNSLSPEWTKQLVNSLIRQTVYRGVDRHRVKVVHKMRRTGKTSMRWNTEEIWERTSPHLRIVTDDLWLRANAAIDARKRKKHSVRGSDHPLFGVPRDSRGPLANVFICGCCGHKMHMDGRNEGGYRCGMCRKKNGCWNRATALRDFTHQALGQAIAEKLLAVEAVTDKLVAFAQHLYSSEDHWKQAVAQLEAEAQELQRQQSRLVRLACTVDAPPESLVAQLTSIEGRHTQISAELEELAVRSQERKPELVERRIVEALKNCSRQLLSVGREAVTAFELLVPGKIRAVPYQQFGSNKVVLMAEFELHLVNIVPVNLRDAFQNLKLDEVSWAEPVPMQVKLFTPSTLPEIGCRALELRESGAGKPMPIAEISSILGVNQAQVKRALQYGRSMRAAGLTSPYIRLTEKPERASRWRDGKEGDIEEAG